MEDGQERRSSKGTLAVQGSSAVERHWAGSRVRAGAGGQELPGCCVAPGQAPVQNWSLEVKGRALFTLVAYLWHLQTFLVQDGVCQQFWVLCLCDAVWGCGLSSPPQLPRNGCVSVPLPLRNLTGRKKRDGENKYWKYIVLQINV